MALAARITDLLPRPDTQSTRALFANGRYARLATAIGISCLGDPMSRLAVGLVTYASLHSFALVGIAFLAQGAGSLGVGLSASAFADRIDRRRLAVGLDFTRFVLLLALPFLLHLSIYALLPVMGALGACQALVQAARQAAVPRVVDPELLAAANMFAATTQGIANTLGYAVGAAILLVLPDPSWLFPLDGLTFALAAALTWTVGDLGGGVRTGNLRGGVARAFRVPGASAFIVGAAAAAFLLSVVTPAQLGLAHEFPGLPQNQAYALINAGITFGVFLGSVFLTRVVQRSIAYALALGLALQMIGLASIAATPVLWFVPALIGVAALGNVVYMVGNQTGIQRLGRNEELGNLMAVRGAVAQAAALAGLALGGVATDVLGPHATVGVAAAGMLLLLAEKSWRHLAGQWSSQAR